MNTPVSFPIAKLLKEKGFNDQTKYNYDLNEEIHNAGMQNHNEHNLKISAPYIADVIMWLYEKYGIWIYTVKDYDMPKFSYAIQRPNVYSVLSHLHNDFGSSKEAYEAAIEYTLKNLI